MRTLLLAILLSGASFAAGSAAQAPPDGVFKAMSDEMDRTLKRLQMQNLGKPYFMAVTVLDMHRLELESNFGALKDPQAYASRQARLDLRVGDYDFDNTHYVPTDYWRYRPFTTRLALDDDYDALRASLWLLADETYKYAVQKLAQKKAYKQTRMISEQIPDLSHESLQTAIEKPPPAAPFDRPLWESRVRQVSAVFRKYPKIKNSAVNLYWTQRTTYFLDSEGRRVLKPEDDYEIVMEAAAQAEDGYAVGDRRRFIRQRLEDMPSPEALEAEAVKLADDVSALAQAKIAGPYVGPVLLEDQAAAEFFNQLLAYNVSFPRSLWIENEGVKEEFPSGKFASRLGQRVVSPILNVEDDPTLSSFEGIPLLGHYAVDDEGIPARKVGLIEKGILKDVLMGRTPIKEKRQSNGHGRSDFFEHNTGRIGNLVIRSDKGLSKAALKRELLRQAREFGLDYGLIIRRIGEEDLQEKEEPLAMPILAYKVYVQDGHEELVRNAQFAGVTLRTLRDIVATSKEDHVYNYYQLGPYRIGRGQLQASIVHPSVLLAEMELKKTEKKPERLPYLKHPYFER